MPLLTTLKASLKDYCEKTDLIGMVYISNRNIHLSERVFWLVCLILATGGSYSVIREYQRTFESSAIGFVIEDTGIQDKTDFASLGLCNCHSYYDPALDEYVLGMGAKREEDYEVSMFLRNVIHMYITDSPTEPCDYLATCPECLQCPRTDYESIAKLVERNCSAVLSNCSWNGIQFNCCDYFLPIKTPVGRCFALNSIHTADKNGPHWLKAEVGWEAGDGELVVHLSTPVTLFFMNEEDIPMHFITENGYKIKVWHSTEFELYVQDMINDPGIRQISPEYRRCKFLDENSPDSAYDFYSFGTCAADCAKRIQFEKCGCNIFHLRLRDDDPIPSCDLEGLKCLEKYEIMIISPLFFQPWRTDEMKCDCMMSCNEREYNVFGEHRADPVMGYNYTNYEIKIKQKKAKEIFRRQVIRSQLDIVVTLGGILGLFMGASIISVIEIFYFVCVRIFFRSKE